MIKLKYFCAVFLITVSSIGCSPQISEEKPEKLDNISYSPEFVEAKLNELELTRYQLELAKHQLENLTQRSYGYGSSAYDSTVYGSTAYASTDPFESDFSPIIEGKFETIGQAFKEGVELLRSNDYVVSVNSIFLIGTTEKKEMGHLVWKETNEKWKVWYALSFQVIQPKSGQGYWKLSHRVVGTRSGEEDRIFEPYDFDLIGKEVSSIYLSLMNLLSEK